MKQQDQTKTIYNASKQGASQLAELLESGCDINDGNDGSGTALMFAAMEGQADVVQLLLASGANPNIQNTLGFSPLMFAVLNGSTDVIELILARDTDLNLKASYGATALILAANEGDPKVVQLLLANEADPNIQDHSGKTALMIASTRGYVEIVQMLMDANVDINHQSENGRTALHEAVKSNEKSIIRLLLESGVNEDLKKSSEKFLKDLLIMDAEYIEALLKQSKTPCVALQERWALANETEKAKIIEEDNRWVLREAYLFSDVEFARQLFCHAEGLNIQISEIIIQDNFLLMRMLMRHPIKQKLVEEILAAGFTQMTPESLLDFGLTHLVSDYLADGDKKQAEKNYRKHNQSIRTQHKVQLFRIFFGILFTRITEELSQKDSFQEKLHQFVNQYFTWYAESGALQIAMYINPQSNRFFQPQISQGQSYIRFQSCTSIFNNNMNYFMSSVYELLYLNKSLRATDLLLELLTHSKFIIGKKGSEGDYESQFILNRSQLKSIIEWVRERFVKSSEQGNDLYADSTEQEYKNALKQIISDSKLFVVNEGKSIKGILEKIESKIESSENLTQKTMMR